MMRDVVFMEEIYQGLLEINRIATIAYQYNERQLVYQRDKLKIYHYKPKTDVTHSIPLLVVFATVNRPEILDLFPDNSFIGGLLENGMDVYLLDWGYPDLSDKHLAIHDYIQYLDDGVQSIRAQTNQPAINLLGICQGGVFCLCYSAICDAVKNLVLISTPVDFQTDDNTISHFLTKIDFDEFVRLAGNVSGLWLTQFFISLRPFELIGKKYLRFIDNLSNKEATEKFLHVEKWLYDAPDQAGKAFNEFVQLFYRQNKLIKGEFSIKRKKVDLKKVTLPVLNVMAREDEIIPVSASKPLENYIGSKDYAQMVFPSGHIGIYISEKVGKNMSQSIAQWLNERNR